MLASSNSKTQPIQRPSVSYVDPVETAKRKFREHYVGYNDASAEPGAVANGLSQWLAFLGAIRLLDIVEFHRGEDGLFLVDAPAAKKQVAMFLGITPKYYVEDTNKKLLSLRFTGSIASVNKDAHVGMVALDLGYDLATGASKIYQARIINKSREPFVYITIVPKEPTLEEPEPGDKFTINAEIPGVLVKSKVIPEQRYIEGAMQFPEVVLSGEDTLREIQQSAKTMFAHS